MGFNTKSLTNLRAGKNKKWQHTPTQAVRVPTVFAEQLLKIARKLDSGDSAVQQDFSLESLELEELLEIQSRLPELIKLRQEARCDRRLEQAILWLASRCDGAAKNDGKGFNAFDAKYGKWLAAQINAEQALQATIARSALEMVAKYSATQLEPAGLSLPQWEMIENQYKFAVQQNREGYRLELHGKQIFSYSPYDPGVLAEIKSIEPRGRFNGEDKSWRFPLEAASELLEKFGDWDYVDPSIEAVVLQQERTTALAEQAKLDQANEIGKGLAALIKSANLDQKLTCGWSLFAHQKEAVGWLLAHKREGIYRGGILADHMGLGKTISALVAAKALSAANDNAPVFVVCPSSLRDNWVREAEKVGLAIEVFSWAKMPKPLDSNPFVLIADEAHYAQNPKSARTKNLLALANSENCLATWLLTGTPIKNGRPINLLPLLTAIDHPLAEDQWAYQRYYCAGHKKSIGSGRSAWDASGAAHLDELAQKTRDAILRRTKDECLDLPEKQRILTPAQLEPKQSKAYNAEIKVMTEEYRQRLSEAKKSGDKKLIANLENAQALVTLGNLRRVGSKYKVESAVQQTEELLEQNQSVVIFTEFVDSAKQLYSRFEKAELLTGETPAEERQKTVDRFQGGESKVFIGTIKAGGVGLTLTASSNVILVDRPWTPGDAEQAEDRCHRIGQNNAVSAYWLQLGQVDSAVDSLLQSKQKRIDLILKGKRKTLRGIDSPSELAKQLLEIL